MNHVDLEKLVLKSGGHTAGTGEFCVMEAVAYFAHEPHSDRPKCTSRAISAFLMSWNDSLGDVDRQKLKRYIPLVVGTATTEEDEQTRAWLATDWLARVFAPTWLELAERLSVEKTGKSLGLKEHAAQLRNLKAIETDETADAAIETLKAARSAAESAAWSAAESAARSAARSAAESAAESAAWSAARSAAWSAAWSAAESAARSAAESAAWSAAESAAWSAAESAATDALAPTVAILQESAFDLLDRMIAVGKEVLAK